MAEEKIRFAIDSTFSGEGFTKASAATAKASKDVTGLGHSLLTLAQQFGLMDGPIGKFVNGAVSAGRAITELAKSSSVLKAAFSPIGLAIAGVTAAIGGAIASFKMIRDHMNEVDEAARTNVTTFEQLVGAHRRLQQSIEGARKAALEKEFGSRIEDAKAEAKAVDEVAKAYAALAAAESAVSGAKGDLRIAKLTNEFNEKLRKAADELEKGVIAAERDLAIAQERGAQAVNKAADAAEEQRQSLISLNQKIAAQTALVENLNAAGKNAEKEEAALAALLNARQVQEKKVEAADLALETARTKAAEDEAAQTAALNKLKISTDEARKAREEAAAAEKEEAAAALAAAAYKRKLNDQLEAKEAEAAAVENRIAVAEKNHAAVTEARKAEQSRIAGGVATDLAKHAGITGNGYQYQLGANGVPDNFIDWQRAGRYAEWGARESANRANRDAAYDRKYNDLLDKSILGKNLTDADKKFMEDYEDYLDNSGKDGMDKIVEGIIGADKRTLSDLYNDIDDLKNELGLK